MRAAAGASTFRGGLASFLLLHGAGDVGWYWHLVERELRRRAHAVAAPDLPCDDDRAGLPEYADAALAAARGPGELVVVAQSFGAFTAPLVCARAAARLLVLVAGMVPAPGERPEDWPAATGLARARSGSEGPPLGELELFYHDVPRPLALEALRRGRRQSETPGRSPWPLRTWPDVPTRFILCRGDRLFPAAFQRRVVRERLGVAPDEMDGGHCVALSRPVELADRLEGYLAADPGPRAGRATGRARR